MKIEYVAVRARPPKGMAVGRWEEAGRGARRKSGWRVIRGERGYEGKPGKGGDIRGWDRDMR